MCECAYVSHTDCLPLHHPAALNDKLLDKTEQKLFHLQTVIGTDLWCVSIFML